MSDKKRTTILINKDLREWWKNNSPYSLSRFIEMKMRELSSSFKPDMANEQKVSTVALSDKKSLKNLEWIKK